METECNTKDTFIEKRNISNKVEVFMSTSSKTPLQYKTPCHFERHFSLYGKNTAHAKLISLGHKTSQAVIELNEHKMGLASTLECGHAVE